MSTSKIESGYQLFTRVIQRPTLENLHPIIFPQGPHNNDVILVTGDNSTGKTLLITDLIARCILPIDSQGKNSAAILINTDHHFNLFKLMSILESFLKNKTNVHKIIENCLKNLIILNCYDAEQLRFTFKNLERILNDNFNINFLVIDSIHAYFWSDRGYGGALSINGYAAQLINELKEVTSNRNIVTVFTKCDIETHIKSLNDLIDRTVHLKKHGADKYTAIVYNHFDKSRISKQYRISNILIFEDDKEINK